MLAGRLIGRLAGCMMVGALLGAPPPAAAQDRSIGFTYAPSLSLHEAESLLGCCSAAGAWVTIGRLHVEHVVAWDSHWRRRAVEWDFPEGTTPEKIDGHALTALWTLRSWETPRFRTRFQIGGRHGTAVAPTPRAWGAGAGLDVRYVIGPAILRGAVHVLLPKPPEARIGFGFRF